MATQEEMDMARKYCTRCNRGIYTSWRTLDDKKYYHPQCFTCADCGIILESVEQYGLVTSNNEIYCGRCHTDRFPVYNGKKRNANRKVDPYESFPLTASSNLGDEAYPPNSQYYFDGQHHSDDNDASNNNINVIYSSPSPFSPKECHLVQEQEDLPRYGAMRNVKKKVKTRKSEPGIHDERSTGIQKKKGAVAHPTEQSSSSIFSSATVNDRCESSKVSKIPRPTSANSRKSLANTAIQSPVPSKIKTSRSQVEKKPSAFRPPQSPQRYNTAVTPKMQRSVSLVQTTRNVDTGNSVGYSPKPAARMSSQSRPRSASTTREEKQFLQTENHNVRTSVSNTKRHCAASFSTKRKKESKSSLKKQQIRKGTDEYSSIMHPTSDKYLDLRRRIPSTQAILNAIGKDGSEVMKLKSATGFPLTSSDSYDVDVSKRDKIGYNSNSVSALPKRSFNMTFECPICISSLVPGGNNNEKGGSDSDSKGLCRNVVTPCGHLFHAKCMQNWLEIKGNRRCPICSALCLPETLQPVYLECNLCADLNSNPNSKSLLVPVDSHPRMSKNEWREIEEIQAAFGSLRSEYELLNAKYNAVVAENHNYSLNATLTSSLQSAYDMECRNRLQLQWENRKLHMQIEELLNANSKSCTQSSLHDTINN